ncbi:sensor histidine kinase [Paenibacillus lentus]|uniref:sensor histidine kinase n=1 Tax=Paenibacillus lentus TaxID=1338368 RepID=UPI001FE60CEB|nr:ATP-binding protein [Paenibacillus lentus]
MKLLLQPLLENSIYHGIKEKEGPGLVKVKFMRNEEQLRVAVIDNGIGINPEALAKIQRRLESDEERTKHVGMFNTNKRLRLMYNHMYSFRIRSKPGLGTLIEIVLPVQKERHE